MNKNVLFYFSLFFASGIAMASLRADTVTECAILVCVLIAVPVIFVLKKYPKLLYLVFLLGLILGCVRIKAEKNNYDSYKYLRDGKHEFICTVRDISYSEPYTMLTSSVSMVDGAEADFNVKAIIRSTQNTYHYGDVLSVQGKLSPPSGSGDIDYTPYNYSRGLAGAVFSYDSKIEFLGNELKSYDLFGWGYEVRNKMKQIVFDCMPEEEAGLMVAFMFGDKSGLDDETLENSRIAGVAHAMATSGLHVSILIMCFSGLANLFIGRIKVTSFINIIVLGLLYVIIGYSPSISRAIIMSMMAFAANLFERRSNSFTTLGCSALVLLMFRPYALFDVSFILSYSAVLGVIVVNGIIRKSGLKLGKIADGLIVSCSAVMLSSVFSAYYFDRLSVIGVFVSSLIIPVLTIVLPIGYLTSLSGMVWTGLTKPLAFVGRIMIAVYEKIVNFSAGISFASVKIEKLSTLQIIVFLFIVYIICSALGMLAVRRRNRLRAEKYNEQKAVRGRVEDDCIRTEKGSA